MMKALFIGRFQPFHNGHLSAIKQILKDCDSVIIAIGSSQEKGTERNPFSAVERENMVVNSLKENNIKNYQIIKVPDFPECDEKWVKSILNNIDFDIVYSNNEWVVNCFKSIKEARSIKKEVDISGTKIRKMIKNKEDISEFVPDYVLKRLL